MIARSRRVRFAAAIAALASMLFVQVSLALGCDIAPRAKAAGQEASAAPCHEVEETVNLCAAHCRSNDQALEKPQVKLPVAATAVAAIPAAPIAQFISAVPTRSAPLPAGPPPRILYRSFLI